MSQGTITVVIIGPSGRLLIVDSCAVVCLEYRNFWLLCAIVQTSKLLECILEVTVGKSSIGCQTHIWDNGGCIDFVVDVCVDVVIIHKICSFFTYINVYFFKEVYSSLQENINVHL